MVSKFCCIRLESSASTYMVCDLDVMISQVDSFMTSVYLLLETHGQSERSYDIHVLTCTGIICLKPIMQH